ncbi:3-dehydroquinate dehydratase [Variibacter gotjawalensis]|uniref:3-dehydroquinate dehydratase n=1 Tax=Variibacter gotjawalensis TaxID=1333996 RepID=A0A0S3PYN6_9BRAD|nr:type II 3-dehydroquinate dehydratase [Variibacter gotjawalensis]NIK46715.1 3-dehydroquinate dehydratase-2 [Variibacter gotjawalensis]RZS48618.1 3-dehydroquinate dehydratase [Variibacter gotjawalensis]BAT60880.1 3-dehydroquinate dehydratase [Variibacter gotjawalensis]
MAKTVYVINGPNLNLLGVRQPEVYGRATLADVEKLCRARAKRHGLEVDFFQSNSESAIIDKLHEARAKKAFAVVINPAGYSYYSVAVLDAVIACEIPTFEVHISNIHAREPLRQHSLISAAARAVIAGYGIEGYGLAIDGAAALLATDTKTKR